MALGTAAINQAIKEGKAAQTLRVLRNPAVALHGVASACAPAYQEQLAALMATKTQTGKNLGAVRNPHTPQEAGVHPCLSHFGGAAPPTTPPPQQHLSCREREAVLDPAPAAGWR